MSSTPFLLSCKHPLGMHIAFCVSIVVDLARLEGVEPSSMGLEAIVLAIGRQTHISTQGRIRTHEPFGMVLETIAFDRSATCVFVALVGFEPTLTGF
jgi:hypothetical protein